MNHRNSLDGTLQERLDGSFFFKRIYATQMRMVQEQHRVGGDRSSDSNAIVPVFRKVSGSIVDPLRKY